MKKILLCLFLFLFLSSSVLAMSPGERLPDPALEARARDISRHLRCPVCQGEAIDESNAELAADLRRLVRQRLAAGDTDGEVLDYMRRRYGDYILLNPPLTGRTLLLWMTPLLVLAAGGIVMWRRARRTERG